MKITGQGEESKAADLAGEENGNGTQGGCGAGNMSAKNLDPTALKGAEKD